MRRPFRLSPLHVNGYLTAAWGVTLDEGRYRMDMHEVGDLRVNTSSMSINVVADTIEYFPEHIDPDPLLEFMEQSFGDN